MKQTKGFLRRAASFAFALAVFASTATESVGNLFGKETINTAVEVSADTTISVTSNQIYDYVTSRVGQSYKSGYCLAFVADVFQEMGATRSSACCAHKYADSHLISSSLDNIPVGADVYFKGSTTTCSCGNEAGHVGIYIGDGKMVDAAGGSIRTCAISSFNNGGRWSYRGWGYHGNVNITDTSFVIKNDDILGIPYPRPASNINIKKGDTGNNVKWLQYALNKAAGTNLVVDGNFGANTYNAVVSFQKEHDLDGDGICGPKTIDMLVKVISGYVPDPGNNDPANPYAEPSANQSAAKHDAEGTKWLQFELNLVGKYGLDVDGKFGTKTHNALVDFQSRYGLSADGICGPQTRAKLREVAGNGGIAPVVVVTTKIPYAEPTTDQSVNNHTAEGAKWVQYAMNLLINAGLDVDGKFGAKTKAAVVSYQSKKGLDADGIVGAKTRAAVNADVAAMNAPVLSHIIIASLPSKVEYFSGEQFNSSGLAVDAVMSDGSTRRLSTSEYSVSGYTNTPGNKSITVSYSGKSAMFTVSVYEIAPSSLKIATYPAKTSYYVGDEFETNGLVLSVTYNNGTSKQVTDGFSTQYDFSVAGDRNVTILYQGLSVNFTVTVSECVLQSLAIVSNPEKTTYLVGETFVPDGLSVNAVYSSGQVVNVTSECLFDYDFSAVGEAVVTVSYSTVKAYFNVTVNPVCATEISIVSLPEKLVYNIGEALDTTGLVFTVMYNNGTETTISDYAVDFTFDTAGETVVTFEYEGVSASFTVTVNAPVELIISKTENEASVDLSWNAIDGAQIYYVLLNGEAVFETDGLSCTLTDFEFGVENTVRVAAFKDMEQLAFSECSFNIEAPATTLPEETTVEEITSTEEIPDETTIADENAIKLSAGNVTAAAGETIEYPVYISNNTGFSATILTVDYDASKLTLKGIDNNGVFSSGSMTVGGDISTVPFKIILNSPLSEITEDGLLVTIRFTVNENTEDCVTPVTIGYDKKSTFDLSFNNVLFTVENGTITVESSEQLNGDVDGDGEITLKDCTLIDRFIAGGYGVVLDEKSMDVDGDGELTLKDSVLISRYLAGGYGVEL